MKLILFGDPGQERPRVLLNDGARVDVAGFSSAPSFDHNEEFFARDGLTRLRAWAADRLHTAPRVQPALRLGPPLS